MREPLQNANRLTLNLLKECLCPAVRKQTFLQMLFPAELRQADSAHLLDFIYCADTDFRNARTSFLNGNIVRYAKDQTFSRAHQAELTLIAAYLHDAAACERWIQYLSGQFLVPDFTAVSALIPLDAARYPKLFSDAIYAANQPQHVYRLILLLLLWAIFGERIGEVNGIFAVQHPESARYQQISTTEWLHRNMHDLQALNGLDMAFHSGDTLLSHTDRIDILLKLIRNGVKLRVLTDGGMSAEEMSPHMRHSDRFILTKEQRIAYWCAFQERYPDSVEVRTSNLPILRNYFQFHAISPAQAAMRVGFYTYGNGYVEENFYLYPEADTHFYHLFENEFRYLWEIGTPAVGAHAL
ncbi:MAG TPA: hypothetical protein DCG49_12165 [Ruminococcus sp.]|nr:hypothetical protein [Ruminococcus sp.]